MRECTNLTKDNKENEGVGWRWFDWVRRENFLAEQNGTVDMAAGFGGSGRELAQIFAREIRSLKIDQNLLPSVAAI
jgi:hypothetical protein